MRVQTAEYRDVRAWLDLAAEVESLFGDLLGGPRFYQALLRNIERRTAFCVREGNGPAGTPLMGGMLFSPPNEDRAEYRIGWLAVATKCRRRGVGRQLVEHAISMVEVPSVITVETFSEDVQQGTPARRLYERLGFYPMARYATPADRGPRQVYRRDFAWSGKTGTCPNA